MVFCLEQGANDLHMVQLMPLPPHHLLLHSNSDWFKLSGAGLPRLSWKQRPSNWCLSCFGHDWWLRPVAFSQANVPSTSLVSGSSAGRAPIATVAGLTVNVPRTFSSLI